MPQELVGRRFDISGTANNHRMTGPRDLYAQQRLQNDSARIDSASLLLKEAIPAKEDISPAVDPTDARSGKWQTAEDDAPAAPKKSAELHEVIQTDATCQGEFSDCGKDLRRNWRWPLWRRITVSRHACSFGLPLPCGFLDRSIRSL